VKVVEKRLVQAQGRQNVVIAEKNIHMPLDHPAIVHLHFAFQDESALYFVLELVEGGDLFEQITRLGTCSLKFAQFYAAEIVVILEYLRSRRIAHRDVKPQNLLLTLQGHLKLIDFDAAVLVPGDGEGDAAGGRCQGKIMAPAGTAQYLPPEVLQGSVQLRDAFALDLWALGCIVFQMLVGRTPFFSSQEEVMFALIRRYEYSFPRGFQHQPSIDFVHGLLSSVPKRVGLRRLDDLKRHALFGGSLASFGAILQQRPPPRVDRIVRWASKDDADDELPFDFASSAECTPEIGQNFLSRKAEQIQVCDADFANSTEITLTIETPPASPPLQLLDTCLVPPGSQKKTLVQLDESPPAISPDLLTSASAKLVRPDMPFVSWEEWRHELLLRQTLLHNEGVVMCGSVVCRFIPCMRPKVLMLTDVPRLLLLDTSGLALLNDIELTGPDSSTAVATSIFDFELRSPKRKYRCFDSYIGAAEWVNKIRAACERLKVAKS
jgi:3-phosphoinositide dependent protein kinase-1